MKYCPYCGVSINGDAAFFCPECGKALRQKKHSALEGRHRRPSGRRRPQQPLRPPVDDHYDGYYDDVKPIDADQTAPKHDPQMVKQIIGVMVGAMAVIALAAVLMFLL